jgi:molybdopterin/thiamine biosynthesis adenylyltransferase
VLEKLASHNPDVKRLIEKGYALAVDTNCLVVRDIPYLGADRSLQWGALVAKLEFVDQQRVTQPDHQVWFAGGIPHNLDGTPVGNLAGGPAQVSLSPRCSDVVVQRSFSNKPRDTGRYADFFDKIDSYVSIISGPAIELHHVTPYTFRVVEAEEQGSVFKFCDTLTTLAEISDLSARFHDDIVAVVGLGGTGAYLLDFLVKMPVQEIRGFDGDTFHVHNTFRSPGHLEEGELGKPKAAVYQSRYESFRHGLSMHARYLDATCTDDLDGVTFAFVCVDKGSSRAAIFDVLIAKGIPFIDVGMGLDRTQGTINGLIRTIYYPPSQAAAMRDSRLSPLTDNPDDIYRTNVQIAELNALNASLAIIRFKQVREFYVDELTMNYLLFGIGDLKLAGE